MTAAWPDRVERPCQAVGRAPPKLVVLRSPYREVLEPLVPDVEAADDGQPRTRHRGDRPASSLSDAGTTCSCTTTPPRC